MIKFGIFSLLGIILIISFFGFYFFREIKFFFNTPKIIILNPKEDFATNKREINFQGQIKGEIKNLTINSEKLYIDETGNFNKTVYLAKGLNIIALKAEDQKGEANIILRKILLKND